VAKPKAKTKAPRITTRERQPDLSTSDSTGGTGLAGLPAAIEKLSAGRIVFALFVLSLLAYSNSWGGDFVFDDADQVVANRDIRSWSNLHRAFNTHVWAFRERPETLRIPVPPPYYRPIFTVLLTLEYQAFGLWPQGWHLVSVLLHILCAIGLYYVLLLVSGRNAVAAIAAAIFAVFPAHAESVSWISGVTDPLFAVFYLASFFFYLKHRLSRSRTHLAASLFLFVLAAFSKETALSLVALVFVYELIEPGDPRPTSRQDLWARSRGAILRALPYGACVVAYLVPRYLVLGALTWKNPQAYQGPGIHVLWTLPSVIGSYFVHLLWPVNLSVAYDTEFVKSPLSPHFYLYAVVLTVIVVSLIAYRARVGKLVWLAIAFILIPLLPVLNLGQLSDQYLISDRYLYLPVAGWSVLIALGFNSLARRFGAEATGSKNVGSTGRRGVLISGALVLLLASMVAVCARENRNWADEYALWSNAARIRPQFWAAPYNVGVALIDSKKFDEARPWLERAAKLAPDEPNIFDALGRCYDAADDTENAVANFEHAIALDSTMFESLNNLGTVYFKMKDYRSAEKQFTAALNLKPQAAAPRFNLALCLERQSRFAEAARQFELVIGVVPEDAEAHYQLGLMYEKTGRRADAIRTLEWGLSLTKSRELSEKIASTLNRIQSGK
jgi:protein O-mannosyl-transferase